MDPNLIGFAEIKIVPDMSINLGFKEIGSGEMPRSGHSGQAIILVRWLC